VTSKAAPAWHNFSPVSDKTIHLSTAVSSHAALDGQILHPTADIPCVNDVTLSNETCQIERSKAAQFYEGLKALKVVPL
jgi:hypothetical protein